MQPESRLSNKGHMRVQWSRYFFKIFSCYTQLFNLDKLVNSINTVENL